MVWTRLIRFQDDAGATRFGKPVIDSTEDLNLLLENSEFFASDFESSSPFALTGLGSKQHVKKIWEFDP
jgi:hypothetical protein